MTRRLNIRAGSRAVLVVHRAALNSKHLVYVACANNLVPYAHGKSRIVYIGTTKKGVDRVATSAAKKSKQVLRLRGLKTIECYLVTCNRRPSVRTWQKLEIALILAFKDVFGEIPIGNTAGKNKHWSDETDYFRLARLRSIVSSFSKPARKTQRRGRARR